MRKYILIILGVILLAITSCAGRKDEKSTANKLAKQISVEDFYKKPQQTSFELSPQGKFYLYCAPVNGTYNIFIKEIGKSESIQLTHSIDEDIDNAFWFTENYILFMQDTKGNENNKLYRFNTNSKEIKCLTDFENSSTSILDNFIKNPDEIIIGLNKRDPKATDVYRLNILTGELRMIAQNPGDVRAWQVDNDGVVRIAYTGGVLYRKDENSEFKKLIDNEGEDEMFSIKFFAPNNNTVYAYSNVGRDKVAIVEYDLENNKEVRVLFEDPMYDAFGDDEIDHFRYSASKQTLTYALYTAEKRTLHFFDEDLKIIYHKIEEKIGNYEIQFASISEDYNMIMLMIKSDKFEGAFYSYDNANDKLQFIAKVTPWLEEEEMAEMKPIQYTSRDGLTIHGYLTIPKAMEANNLPVIVFPHAGPEWRNTWKFDPDIQFYANRGYAVLNVNFRGSEGYGKKFFKAGFKQRGLKMQDDITDGVNWLIDQGIADKERIAIFGRSYGGYAALVGVTLTPDLYACAIDFWGISNNFDWYNNFPPQWIPFLGQVHRRWFDPSVDSIMMRQSSPIFHVENIKVPVFIAQGANDVRVKSGQSENMVKELKKYNKEYEYFAIQGEGHGVSDEKKLIEMMTRVELFLEKHMPSKKATSVDKTLKIK